MRKLRKFAASLGTLFVVFFPLFSAAPAHATSCVNEYEMVPPAPGEVLTYFTCGGDDSSYLIPLSQPVIFQGVSYDHIYATTNSVISFGQADGTYWDYPQTVSISIMSQDWVAYPLSRADEQFIITVSDAGFQIDEIVRPWANQGVQYATHVTITAVKQYDGSFAYSYTIDDPNNYSGLRTGVRLADGTIVTLEEAGITRLLEPPVVPPTAEPESTPSPEPTPTIEPTSTPEPTPEPTVEPSPTSTPEPTSQPTFEPSPEPTSTETVTPEPTPSQSETVPPVIPESPTQTLEPVLPPVEEPTQPAPLETVPPEPVQPEEVAPLPEPSPSESPLPDVTSLDPSDINPQELSSAEVAALKEAAFEVLATAEPGSPEYKKALEQLWVAAEADDIQLDPAIAAIPLIGNVAQELTDAINFVGNVGADMSPTVRETAKKEVVTAVVAVGAAIQATSFVSSGAGSSSVSSRRKI